MFSSSYNKEEFFDHSGVSLSAGKIKRDESEKQELAELMGNNGDLTQISNQAIPSMAQDQPKP